MSVDLLRRIDAAKSRLEKTMQLASETEGIDVKAMESDIMNVTEEICKTEEAIKAHQKALRTAAPSNTVDEFDKVYADDFKKHQVKDIKSSDSYKDMCNVANIYLRSGDANSGATTNVVDDDVEMEENIQTVDPLTKNPLVHPVRNKLCNHVYEKSSITEAIQMNRRTRCPAVGCPNKKCLELADLVEDTLLQKKLAHMRAQEQRDNDEEESDSD